jgi:hypothetical protein
MNDLPPSVLVGPKANTNDLVNRLFWPAALAERNPRRHWGPHSDAWTNRTRPPSRRGPRRREARAKRLRFRYVYRPSLCLPF